MILSFLADLFAQSSEVAFSRAKVALDAELIRWQESGVEVQNSAASYLRQWIASGWLREQDDKLKAAASRPVICVSGDLASYERKRLIEQKVPFIVPGNQLYLPDLGIGVRGSRLESGACRYRGACLW